MATNDNSYTTKNEQEEEEDDDNFAMVMNNNNTSNKESLAELRQRIELYRTHFCKEISYIAAKKKNREEEEEELLSLPNDFFQSITTEQREQLNVEMMLINDGVTPIMLSCDLNLPRVLQQLLRYISKPLLASYDDHSRATLSIAAVVIGHPYDKSSTLQCGGNTAAHYAAHANSLDCFKMIIQWEKDSSTIILNQKNSHGDTPLMMAVTENNVQVVRYIISRSIIQKEQQQLHVCNQSGDTVLSLAYGHGRVDILHELLLVLQKFQKNNNLPLLLNNHLRKCQKILNISQAYIQQQDDKEDIQLVKQQKYSQIQTCLGLLHDAYSFQQTYAEQEATKKMNELLLLEEQEQDNKTLIAKRQKKKKKKKKSIHITDVAVTPTEEEMTVSHATNNNISDNGMESSNITCSIITTNKMNYNTAITTSPTTAPSINIPKFVTLCNGSVVATTTAAAAKLQQDASSSSSTTVEEGCITATKCDAVVSSSSHVAESNTNIHNMFLKQCPEADSLCVDVSMLLLTTHNMAMLLSPCQLESIERLLQKQVTCVKEARCIQKRVWDGLSRNNKNE